MMIIILLIMACGCLQAQRPGNTTPGSPSVLPTETQPECCDYCYIQEVQPDSIDGEVIVPLTAEDLKDFPQFGRSSCILMMMVPKNG